MYMWVLGRQPEPPVTGAADVSGVSGVSGLPGVTGRVGVTGVAGTVGPVGGRSAHSGCWLTDAVTVVPRSELSRFGGAAQAETG